MVKKETKKVAKQRRVDACMKYNAFVRANLAAYSQDRVFEPANFNNWVNSCEVNGLENLQDMISFVSRALKAAAGSDPIYCESRGYYLRYAEGALKRRFPDAEEHLTTLEQVAKDRGILLGPPTPIPDDLPF